MSRYPGNKKEENQKMTTPSKYDLPLTFRAEVVKPLLGYVSAGDSCAVVGIGSVGKSNLLRFLQREDVRQFYLGDEWSDYLFVYVDINKILKQSGWGLLELMLHQLLIELSNQNAEETTLKLMDDLHEKATDPKTQHLTLRYLDRAMRVVCNQLGWRVVFLIDEFDELCRKMSLRGFGALRALRDEYKYRLMYVVVTRLELKRLREEASEIEAFEELVSPHTFWLGPYSEADARLMVKRLEARHSLALDEDTINNILVATGGHPGLLREAYHTARQQSTLESLTNNLRVQDECQRIWLSLTLEEQRVMVSLAGDSTPPPPQTDVIERLSHKGLVGGPWTDDNHIFSSLFKQHVKQQPPAADTRIHVDHKRHSVWVNGYEIRKLTRLEFKLMAYLEKHRGQICTRDEVAQHLYPDDMKLEGEGVSETRLDSVVKRLRKQIEPNPKEPRYVITVRGQGFQLKNGDESDAP
jgi:DNA-binding winged helix-turn-helix (wHTH) protein